MSQEDIILNSSTLPLEFLTQEDLRLIVERSRSIEYERDHLILEEGSLRQAIFIIIKGRVRVQRVHSEKEIAYVHLGPGEIFGEMSFIENLGASASVYADENVSVQYIEGRHLNSLIASVPGFGTRFYQSLAIILARRLRSTSMMLPPLMLDEVPRRKSVGSHAVIAGRKEMISQDLLRNLQEFRKEMLRIDRSIKNRELKDKDIQIGVDSVCCELCDTFRTSVKNDPGRVNEIAGCVFREAFPFLMLSKKYDYCYTKPRGQAADFQALDLMRDLKCSGAGRLGPFLDRWFSGLTFCQGYRQRVDLIRMEFTKLSSQIGPANVLSVEGGSREEAIPLDESARNNIVLTCVDSDPESIVRISEAYGKRLNFRYIPEDILKLFVQKNRLDLPLQNIVYSVGLLEHLRDEFIIKAFEWTWDLLSKGGTAHFFTFEHNHPDALFVKYLMDWPIQLWKKEQILRYAEQAGVAQHLEIECIESTYQNWIRLQKPH